MMTCSCVKVLKIFIYLISFVILPFNLYIQQTEVGGFSMFPDRQAGDDYLRFGGALYHSHNGMVLGLALLLLIYLMFIHKKKSIIGFLTYQRNLYL